MTPTVALDAYNRAQPQRCPSCERALDVPDLPSMASHRLCAWCLECARPRLDQHGPEGVPFLVRA